MAMKGECKVVFVPAESHEDIREELLRYTEQNEVSCVQDHAKVHHPCLFMPYLMLRESFIHGKQDYPKQPRDPDKAQHCHGIPETASWYFAPISEISLSRRKESSAVRLCICTRSKGLMYA